jgi:glycosyltransferase involved in cell wall biosynthesis
MKVIFVTTYDAEDVRNWSGIPYYMGKAFKNAGIEVHFIGNLKSLPDNYFEFRLKNLVYNKLLKGKFGKFESFYEPKNLKFIARQVKKRIKEIEGGIIFSPGTIPVAYLKTDKPIVVWTDATFAVMENYYDGFKVLSKRAKRNCHLYEKNAIKRSSLAIYSSEWSAKSATKDYVKDPRKVKFIPFGSNIECNRTIKDIIENNEKKSHSICKLLFIGQEWDRKGGDKAIRIATHLNESIKVELTMVGCNPPDSVIVPDFVKVTGFIDKTKREGLEFIDKLYKEHHFFLLPTKAEAMGVVFCEANSFGLPVITTDTGGIPSVIKNDINGKMFNPESDIKEWAFYIEGIFNNFKKYSEYSLTSFNEYSTTLNWGVSVRKFISHLQCLEKAK